MADYTPTLDEVRDIYTWERCVRHGRDDSLDTRHIRAEFDRWLAQERAEAQQAVREQLAAQFTAKAAHARNTSVAFTWQQAARTVAGGAP